MAKYWIIVTAEQKADAEKKILANALRAVATQRFNSDGTIENCVTGQRVDHATLSDDQITNGEYKLYGRKPPHHGTLQHDGAYTETVIEFQEMTDGRFAGAMLEDAQIADSYAKDGSGTIIKPAYTLNYDFLLNGVTYEETVTEKPDFLA
jgi:hypothetical protein